MINAPVDIRPEQRDNIFAKKVEKGLLKPK
jgi:hypothetical protein